MREILNDDGTMFGCIVVEMSNGATVDLPHAIPCMPETRAIRKTSIVSLEPICNIYLIHAKLHQIQSNSVTTTTRLDSDAVISPL